jgi:hypothetical protein
MLILKFALFFCGCKNTDTQWLGQVQLVSGAPCAVSCEMFNCDFAGHCQSENGLWAIDAMAPCQRKPQARAHAAPTRNHACGYAGRQFVDWPAKNGDGGQRPAPHRIDVTDSICCGNSAKVEGIVNDRHKKIGSCEYGPTISKIDGGGIITAVVAHQQIRVLIWIDLAACKDFTKNIRCNFTTAPSAMTVLRETYCVVYHYFLKPL